MRVRECVGDLGLNPQTSLEPWFGRFGNQVGAAGDWTVLTPPLLPLGCEKCRSVQAPNHFTRRSC